MGAHAASVTQREAEMKCGVLILFLLGVGSAQAAGDYRCLVSAAFQVNPQGERNEEILAPMIGAEFTVDRSSGLMVGDLKNSYVTSPKVIDSGSEENSFKVLTLMKNDITSNVYVLTIEEFQDGPIKPFVFLNNSYVYHGTCEHF